MEARREEEEEGGGGWGKGRKEEEGEGCGGTTYRTPVGNMAGGGATGGPASSVMRSEIRSGNWLSKEMSSSSPPRSPGSASS